ncbi:unnamed protein product, partial [marine sediment metagenome]
MYYVGKQVDLMHSVDWDVMFIIDACRFDYFKKYYKEIFHNKGELKKAISPAT